MACCPISPSTVHRILTHISPLEEPLPQNLVSKPLLQRHHFLGLTPDDAAEYVAWPSRSDQSHVLRLLEGQSLPYLGDHLNAQYTADSEDFLAHVCISSDLRLVFLWEGKNGWQYHNLATMPFPPNSFEDFNDAHVLYSKNDFLPEQDHELRVSGGDDDDFYWNSYGQQDEAQLHLSASKVPKDTNSEDAYWARYSIIQGSADSTIPSPLPPAKNIKSEIVNNITNLEQFQERVIVPPTGFQVHRVEPYNPLEPPSPAAISCRLQALSSESPTLLSPLIDEPDSDSETLSRDTEIDAFPPNFVASSRLQIPADDHDAFRIVLQDAIKNLYKLWRLGKQDKSADQDRDAFIHAVQHALEEL